MKGLTAGALALLATALVCATLAAGAASTTVIKTDSDGAPLHVGTGFGSIWVGDHRGGYLFRINPRTDKKIAINVVGGICAVPSFGAGYVWVSGCADDNIYYQVDPKTNRVLRQRPGLYPVFGAGSLWVYDGGTGIARVDPRTGVRLTDINPGVDMSQNGGPLGYWDGKLWVYTDSAVSSIDPQTNKVSAVIPLPGGKPSGDYADGYLYGGLGALADGKIWVTNAAGLYAVDPAAGTATLAPVKIHAMTDFGDLYVAAGNGSVWVRTGDSSVARLDPADGHVQKRYPATGGGGGIVVVSGALWVANAGSDTIWREPIN
jgi:streptogramin lyase